MKTELREYTQNRELSWLTFNDRVLDEAMDPTVPLAERLKFLAIFTSNLDEFFMIRVGSLTDIAALDGHIADSRTGLTAREQLTKIYQRVHGLYEKQDAVYQELREQLRPFGIQSVREKDLTHAERKYAKAYFREQVLPVLSPQIVDRSHPFPHLANKQLYVTARLTRKQENRLGIVPVPSALPDILIFPGENIRFIRMEHLLLCFLHQVFEQYQVQDKNCICVTRNADIEPDDEMFDVDEDLRMHMKKLLHKRRRMAVVRLETAFPMDPQTAEALMKHCDLRPEQIFQTQTPMKMECVYDLIRKLPIDIQERLVYPPFSPQKTVSYDSGGMIKLIQKQDVLLSYPYESMDPFLHLLKEASVSPDVMSIRITIYRLAKHARLVDYLCAAAENGKDVTVLIELRARFDEQNNIDWSERLEDAGCRILYGFETYKVHAKVCQITMRGNHGPRYITQIGTGNYNEKTAAMYTDFSIITSDSAIGHDAAEFFKNMAIGNLNGRYEHLLVAPVGLKETLLRLMEEECAKGEHGRIVIKCNSVTDCELIQGLCAASRAGVQIDLIVRGICCILPGIPGYTDNIRVTSIVGRYLEHARIYAFGAGETRKIWIGSADMMTRNTQRRVEVLAPVHDRELRMKLDRYLDIQLKDTVKARKLLSDGSYAFQTKGAEAIDAQEQCMKDAICLAEKNRESALEHRQKKAGLASRFLQRIKWTG